MVVVQGLLAGALLDALAGDPRSGHPVAVFGRAAAMLERRMYADSRVRGAAFAGSCVLGAAGLGAAAMRLCRGPSAPRARPGRAGRVRFPASGSSADRRMLLLTAVATWTVLGGTSLRAEGRAMAEALRAGRVPEARRRLPHLCGRDPDALDSVGLARATVESVAENTSDAVVAPLLWGAALGVPGMLAYRAVNTLDAMVGHRSPRYVNFGWAAARADDVANWVPARLTGLLAVACAPLVGGSPRSALAVLRRDGAAHPSPNAGRCEAAFAGALGVRLGGRNVYGSRVEHRPELGAGPGPTAAEIQRAVALSRAVTVAALALAAAGRLAVVAAVRLAVRAGFENAGYAPGARSGTRRPRGGRRHDTGGGRSPGRPAEVG